MNNTTSFNESFPPQPVFFYPEMYQEPLALQIVHIALYGIIFLLAFLGNVLVIAVVFKTRELRTVTGYLIANLAGADLGVTLICLPFTIITYQTDNKWLFGKAMCKLIPTVQAMSVAGSVGTLTAISIDRHKTLIHPFEPLPSKTQMRLIIALVWLVSWLLALPALASNTTVEMMGNVYCTEAWPIEWLGTAYTVLSFIMTYAIPLPLIGVLYVRIAIRLNQASKEAANRPGFRATEQKKKIMKMLTSVVVCYAICYLPIHVVLLWDIFGDLRTFKYLRVLFSYSQVLVYSNSASNPLLYAFLGSRFRQAFLRAFGCKEKKALYYVTTVRSQVDNS